MKPTLCALLAVTSITHRRSPDRPETINMLVFGETNAFTMRPTMTLVDPTLGLSVTIDAPDSGTLRFSGHTTSGFHGKHPSIPPVTVPAFVGTYPIVILGHEIARLEAQGNNSFAVYARGETRLRHDRLAHVRCGDCHSQSNFAFDKPQPTTCGSCQQPLPVLAVPFRPDVRCVPEPEPRPTSASRPTTMTRSRPSMPPVKRLPEGPGL